MKRRSRWMSAVLRMPDGDERRDLLARYGAVVEPVHIPLGARVQTPDGAGVTVGMEMRKNTNGGPGTRQYRVRLDDNRVRHYGTHAVTVIA